jgi:hypothetical protein
MRIEFLWGKSMKAHNEDRKGNEKVILKLIVGDRLRGYELHQDRGQ